MKKNNRILIILAILLALTTSMAVMHLNTREEVPEHALKVTVGDEDYLIDIDNLELSQVTGTRVNGKGEELPVDAPGILLKDVLAGENISDFSKVTVFADDSYSAEVSEDEVSEDRKVYLLHEEDSLRLQVFGDENSKRSVTNVVQIVVE